MINKPPVTQEEAQQVFMDAYYSCSDKDKVYEVLIGLKHLLDIPSKT